MGSSKLKSPCSVTETTPLRDPTSYCENFVAAVLLASSLATVPKHVPHARKEGRREGRKEERKEGKKEGRTEEGGRAREKEG
jgi:hypothetical protein